MKKYLSVVLVLFLFVTESVNADAANIVEKNDHLVSNVDMLSTDWQVGNQGYRFYLIDEKGNQISKSLNVTYAELPEKNLINLNSELDSRNISFEKLANLSGETELLPLALGYETDIHTGKSSIISYADVNGKAAINSWFENEMKDYYVTVGDRACNDFRSITEAMIDVKAYELKTGKPKTIYVTLDKYDDGVQGTYIERARDFTDEEAVSPVFVQTFEPAIAVVGLNRVPGRKPTLQNTSVCVTDDNVMLGHYNTNPLCIVGGLFKDIDVYETVSQKAYEDWYASNKEEAIERFGNSIANEFWSYALHCDNKSGLGQTLTFSNCILQSNCGPVLGIGTRKNQDIRFKDCFIYATSKGNSTLVMHNAGDEFGGKYIGNSSISLINSTVKSENTDFMMFILNNDLPDNSITLNMLNFSAENENGKIVLQNMCNDDVSYEVIEIKDISRSNVQIHFNENEKIISKTINDISFSSFGYKNNNIVMHAVPISEYENNSRLNKLVNILLKEDIIDTEKMEDCFLVAEPLVWFKPSLTRYGVIQSETDCIFGTYSELVKYLNEHGYWGNMKHYNSAYPLLMTMQGITVG